MAKTVTQLVGEAQADVLGIGPEKTLGVVAH